MAIREKFIVVAMLLLAICAGRVQGEEFQLKEADIQRIIPVLRAEAADLNSMQAVAEREGAARTNFSGDPLDFLRSRAEFELPREANYAAACSSAASVNGPIAIFTFGREIDCYNRTWRDWKRTAVRGPEENLQAPAISAECNAEGKQTRKFLDGIRTELEKMGYKIMSGISLECYESSDGRLMICLEPDNIYDRAHSTETHPLSVIEGEQAREKALTFCSDMSSGPILILKPGENFYLDEPIDSLDAALRKAGMSEEEYSNMKMSLMMARMLMENEQMLAAYESLAGNEQEQSDLKIQLANMNLYQKHAAELSPLLDAIVP